MKTMLFFNRKYFSFPFGEWPLIIHAVSNVEFHRAKLIDIPSSWLVISRLLVFFVRGLAFKRFIKPRASGRNIVGQLLPTLWDVTCCVRFTPCCMLLYVFACYWELLRKGWKRSNFWASNSQRSFVPWSPKRRTKKRWICLHSSSNIVGAARAH